MRACGGIVHLGSRSRCSCCRRCCRLFGLSFGCCLALGALLFFLKLTLLLLLAPSQLFPRIRLLAFQLSARRLIIRRRRLLLLLLLLYHRRRLDLSVSRLLHVIERHPAGTTVGGLHETPAELVQLLQRHHLPAQHRYLAGVGGLVVAHQHAEFEWRRLDLRALLCFSLGQLASPLLGLGLLASAGLRRLPLSRLQGLLLRQRLFPRKALGRCTRLALSLRMP